MAMEAMEASNISAQFLNIANSSQDILIDSSCENKIQVTFSDRIECYHMLSMKANDITMGQVDNMLKIYEHKMKSFHESCSWTWDPEEKRNEFTHPSNHYIFVFDTDRQNCEEEIIGFCIVRFEYDDLDDPEYPVLFCYELHVRESHMGRKIGTTVMSMLKRISTHFNMHKIMLTCFKNNIPAMEFYQKVGFGIDANSPSACGFMDECYEILSDKSDSM